MLFSYLIAKELLDNRTFKFEKYTSYEDLDKALSKQFPIGTDIRYVISVLKKSGAKYDFMPKSTIISIELKNMI